ncbi:IPTL-CTERM sorting domain-containing protein [Acidovorax sp. NCPPB 2350]|nr:IPTL-CTERM sorting domain-containing protein [Acidovorax sp. NCPPB 2350]
MMHFRTRRPEAGRALRALALLALATTSLGASAQALRTWVSGVGDDANPCARTAPCRTFGAALARTASGGEIDVLDAGAFDFLYGNNGNNGTADTVTYQPLVIDKPVTIDGGGRIAGLGPLAPEDTTAFVTTIASQQDAIVIDLPPGAMGPVTLRNLSLHGAGGTGRHGIRVASASAVSLQNVDVAHFAQDCLRVDAAAAGAQIDASGSSFTHCGSGVAADGAAVINLAGSAVAMNSGTGVIARNAQAVVLAQEAVVSGNSQNSSLLSFTSATPELPGSASGAPAIPAGSASASLSGGLPGCSFASQQFVAPAAVGNGLPSTVFAAQAGFRFGTTACGTGSTVTITLTYSQAMPAGTVLYKYGPAQPGSLVQSWFAVPGAVLSADGRTFTYTVTDNGIGDADSTLGVIADPVVPVVPAGGIGIPALSPAGLAGLAALMAATALAVRRRQLAPRGPLPRGDGRQ